jgi:hypothetical protein
VSVTERCQTIALNLERTRWMPQTLPDPLIRVNIPEWSCGVTRGRRPLSMRVVVGSPSDPTPVFADVITYLELTRLGVPKKILVNEMLPWFKKKGLASPPTTSACSRTIRRRWTRAMCRGSGSTRTRSPTSPGRTRAIESACEIKFMCPNEYDVTRTTRPRRFFERNTRF